jgi:hypothetical protein
MRQLQYLDVGSDKEIGEARLGWMTTIHWSRVRCGWLKATLLKGKMMLGWFELTGSTYG